jgi:menaquinol-cytochrome c reductase iron-sulfur subunit
MKPSAENLRGDAQPGVLVEPRRSFVAMVVALLLGAAAYATPVLAAVVSFFQPLRQKGQGGLSVRLCSLDALPEDGTPRKYPVVMDRTDGWNRFPNEPVGAVFLRRTPGSGTVEAIQVICPHAGCFIDYSVDKKCYTCPCHVSSFDVSGKRAPGKSDSPRDLDSLDVEIRDGKEVWVKSQRFILGRPEKIAEA